MPKKIIAVAGIGYVGLSNAILLSQSNIVRALDVSPERVAMIAARKSPLIDPDIEDYLSNKDLELTATTDPETAFAGADFIVIATPTNYDPEANEKNDYILFNDDMTYESVDEGKKSTGKWTFNAKEKYILMANKEGKKIKLEVEELNSKELVFEIDDKDMKGVDLHYSTQKR